MKQYNVIIPAQHRFPHYQAVNVAPRGLKASELGVASILFAVSLRWKSPMRSMEMVH